MSGTAGFQVSIINCFLNSFSKTWKCRHAAIIIACIRTFLQFCLFHWIRVMRIFSNMRKQTAGHSSELCLKGQNVTVLCFWINYNWQSHHTLIFSYWKSHQSGRSLLLDDEAHKNLWNISRVLADYTVQQPRIQSSSHTLQWELKFASNMHITMIYWSLILSVLLTNISYDFSHWVQDV